MNKLISPSIIIAGIFIINSCSKHPGNFLHRKNQDKVIALQPLDSFDTGQMTFLQQEISEFFKRKVIILKPLMIRDLFRLAADDRYSADSIIKLLNHLSDDTIMEVVGLTHKDVYTVTYNTTIPHDNNIHPVKPIFGLGYLPGKACVVSDYRIRSIDRGKSNRRLRTVVIHEMGHNLGLGHCPDSACIMSDQNGKILTLDTGGNDYCGHCKNHLKL